MVDRTRKDTGTGASGEQSLLNRPIQLSDNARTVLTKRYLRRGADGKPAETIQEMFWRVAWHVAEPEDEHQGDRQAAAERFYDLLTSRRFFPNSPTFTGAGTPLGQLAACFVLDIEDDMGRSESGIFQTLRDAALIQQTGGGNGFAFSSLRPKGALVKTSAGEATGPVGFLRVYDQAFGEIAQGGCLTPDTLVFTERGLLRLDEIVQRDTPGWDEHELIVLTDEGERVSIQAYNNGVVPVLRVQTDVGLEITGTPNHKLKVMTGDGPVWRQLEDLQPGDALLMKLGQHQGQIQTLTDPDYGPVKLNDDLAEQLGCALAGGKVDRWHVRLFKANGLMAFGLHVPKLIRQSPPLVAESFLAGVYRARCVGTALEIPNLPYAFARDAAVLLLGLGYPVQLAEQTEGAYRLAIREVQPDLPQGLTIDSYIGSPFGCGGLSSTQAVLTARVTDVQPAGEILTLDLEVDDNHTYLANGLVSHNSRRGANMGVLRVDHPDIREFITCKTNESHITNFNISVGATDAFMQAVKNDTLFDLINPQDGTVWERVRAREIFDLMVKQAHHNGEPGILFLDAANRDNPVPHLYQLESTNPCFIGETRISTEFGLIRLDELAESGIAGFVASDNRAPAKHRGKAGATLGVALRWASPAWMTRKAVPVKTLITRSGYKITATPDHQFLTPDGYVELRKLKAGDKVLLQSGEGAWSRNPALPNLASVREMVAMLARSEHPDAQQATEANLPTQWSHGLGFALGWLVGRGALSTTGAVVGLPFHDPAMLARTRDILAPWFGEGESHEQNSVTQLDYGRIAYMFFKALGVGEGRSHEKRLPESLWTAPREVVVGFLQGLFSADGSVEIDDEKKDCTIRVASASRGLIEDVQLLLTNFGIMSRLFVKHEPVARRTPTGRVAHGSPYGLMIARGSRTRFAEQIGFASEEMQAKLESFVEASGKPASREHFTDTVSAVVDAGSADVYDLTQYQTHSLIVNGFVASNCGEQFLGPFENCCLGSINLAEHVTDQGKVDWEKLRQSVELSTQFLDDVVDANKYVPAVPQLEVAAKRVRRIGLGVMGLADLMYHQGVRYGSKDGQEFASQVMEFVHYHAMQTSIDLAKERGPFLAIRGSLYDPDDLKWTPPQPLAPYQRDWGRPALDWVGIVDGIKQHGIRNGAVSTVAPTGTISTVAGCEGYGCEPVFALAYMRHFNDNGKDTVLQYTSPLFEKALINAGLDEATRKRIVERVNLTGSCQDTPDLPEHIRHTFVVASDISAEEHVRMQAAMQRFVSNAISKTCNFPPTATPEDVAKAYLLAWELGCKGLTVYVAGSRDKVVLETAETAQAKQAAKSEGAAAAAPKNEPASSGANGTLRAALPPAASNLASAPTGSPKPEPLPLFRDEVKKPRGRMLPGYTYRVETPLGTTFVTINQNGGEQPFEVFLHTSKAGSETAAVSEALGRLISYILRMNANIEPRKRLIEVVRQLEGIGGGRSLGLGPKRVRSLPDGVAQVLREYLAQQEEEAARVLALFDETPEDDLAADEVPEPPPGQMALPILKGDLCPECGEASVVNEEGCRKCHSCGFSEC